MISLEILLSANYAGIAQTVTYIEGRISALAEHTELCNGIIVVNTSNDDSLNPL